MLDRIAIKGYKSIRELDLELKPINILIGSNGVGKSNFISFFELLNNIYEKRLAQYSIQKGNERLLYYGLKQTQEIEGYLKFKNNAYNFSLIPTLNGGLAIKEEKSIYNGKENVYTIKEESIIKDSDSYRDSWLRKYLESYKIYHFHETNIGSPLRVGAKVNDNNFLRTDGSNLPAYLYLLQEKYPKSFKRIENVIGSVMPYFERFDLKPSNLDESVINLQWIDRENNNKFFDVNDLSDGSIRFMALATLLLQPNLPQIIIIDEPELGLHPFAISKLAAMIQLVADRGAQIIVSTQSANLISEFSPNDVITVDRKDKQTTFKRLNEQELHSWLEDYSLGELWMKSVIEGQTL